MACSYVSHYVHIVFGTKDRVHTIREEIQPKLWAYMAGIAKVHGIHAVAIGGFADHAHALIDLGAILGIAKAVQVLKANSSRWMKEQVHAGFEWQEGYFACSVSKSQVATIRQYVVNQKDHHLQWISRKSSSCWRKNMDLRLELGRTSKLVVTSPKGDLVSVGFPSRHSRAGLWILPSPPGLVCGKDLWSDGARTLLEG